MCFQTEKIIKNLKIRSLDLQNESLCATRWRKSLKIFKTEREPTSHKKSLKWEPRCAPRWRKSLKIFKTEHSNNKTNFIEFCSQILQNREFFSLKAKAPRTGNRSSITGSRYRGLQVTSYSQ